MPAPYGLTPYGFSPMSLVEVRDELAKAVHEELGETLDLSDGSLEGKLLGILAERFALLWELLEAIVSSSDPSKASAALLRALCVLTGTSPEPATASRVTLTLTGAADTVIPQGSAARVPGGARFATDEQRTLVALTAWQASTSYVVGARVTNVSRAYTCITAGVSASSGGPTGTAQDITDGAAHWREIGAGVAAADVGATASETGALVAYSGTITEIATPVGGWSGVRNLADAAVGRNAETDPELRARRDTELSEPGTSPPDAIRAALRKVPGVTGAAVFENRSDVIDADGMPPHSVEALVTGGDDQAIRNALLANVAGGIAKHGTISGTAIDSAGEAQLVSFSRPAAVNVYVAITILYDASLYPADGDLQVKQAIVARAARQANGKNAVASAVSSWAFDVPGVIDAVPCYLGTAPSPASSATIAISLRQYAAFDTSRISVTSTAGTP